jgi:hypothetical protein
MNTTLIKTKVRRMLKYFRNKQVSIYYEYNNSLGGHTKRQKNLQYDSFEIVGGSDFNVILKSGNEVVFEQELNEWWEFAGLGKLMLINSGPRCYFTITTLTQL